MKTRDWILSLFPALMVGGAGYLLGTGLLTEVENGPEPQQASTSGASAEEKAENEKLKREIATLESRLATIIKPGPAKAPEPTAAEMKATSLAAALASKNPAERLKAEIEQVKAAIELARIQPLMSDAELKKKVSAIEAAARAAIEEGDGEAAIAALAELAQLDKRAFPTLVSLWAELKGARIPGVGRRETMGMGWGSAELFSWALTTKELGVDADTARAFQASSVMSLRFMEPDSAKRNETYLSFLAGQPAPEALPEGSGGRRGGRGVIMEDPYRGALAMVARSDDPAAGIFLSDAALNPQLPTDVRTTAIRGLVKQTGPEASQALAAASSDPDPKVQQAATLAKVQQNPPATGYFVTDVRNNSQLGAAGVAPGAIITSINGQPIQSGFDVRRLMQSDQETVVVKVLENGAEKEVTVKSNDRLGVDGQTVKAKK